MSGSQTIMTRDSRKSLRGLGLLLLGLCFATASWNAVLIHGVQLDDLLFAGALTCIGIDSWTSGVPRRPLPNGMWVGAALIALAGIWTAYSPPSASYMSLRHEVINPYVQFGSGAGNGGNLTQLVKFEVSLIVLPLCVTMARPTRGEIRWLADMWLFAAVTNAVAAIMDQYAHTGISHHLLGFIDTSGRQSGLTQQPNHLALAIVFAIPVAIAWIAANRRLPLAILLLTVLFWGLLLSGSRGGLVAGACAIPASMLAFRDTRKMIWWVGYAVLILAVIFEQKLATLVNSSRLGGGATVEGSNAARALTRQQGWTDFGYNPLHGIGYSVIDQANEVHLQLLAAGGVLALTGFVIYITAVLRMTFRGAQIDELYGRAFIVTIVLWLALMFVENQLTNLYLYVPIALAAALACKSKATVTEPVLAWTLPPTPQQRFPDMATRNQARYRKSIRFDHKI